MSQYFPKPYEPFGGDINVSHVDVSSFALKSNLASLKIEVDKLDIDKLTPVPNDLGKLSNVVRNDAIKKTEYNANNASIQKILKQGGGVASKDNLDATENKIPNVSSFLSTTVFNFKITEIENKIPNVNNLASKSELTAAENKIPSITGVATNSALNAVENKIHDVDNLIKKKTDFNSKVNELEDQIPSITGLATNSALTVVENKIPDISSLVTETDFDAKLKGICDRVTSNKSKHLLIENELKKLKALDLSYFWGKNYFDGDDGTQYTLVFQVKT